MNSSLRLLILLTDCGLVAYWLVTILSVLGLIDLPPDLLFSDYDNPIVVAWNWSFFPLDIVLSVVGLVGVRLAAQNDPRWWHWTIISLSLTVCAGLMAVSFWAIRGDFDPVWWGFNLYLILWPLPFLLSRTAPVPNSQHHSGGH